MFEIKHTNTEVDIKNEFVAIGSYLNENKEPFHSVLLIRYQNTNYQIHYTGVPGYGILFDTEIEDVCFHKITDTIDEKLIPAFYTMCKRIEKKANPKYGYFYSGEYFDNQGKHFSDKPIGETMTCAGFCLNVLKGFLENDYINYKDWNNQSFPTDDYLKKYAEKNNLDLDKIAESHRRISPLELLSSGFFNIIPISKKQIDTKVDETQQYLLNY
ncbi:hypothetical protein [Empedobacter brevis]|uniref:hypothetical protein n=1 Tax=Empedobacter brevis TaxID=247 RepID=UPI0028D03B29|nr:hypothetical protein [Empedobacter brevis]